MHDDVGVDSTPMGRRPLFVALLLTGVSLIGYALTLAPGVLGGDPGELQFVPYILSLAHPTGYPLQTLLNRLWITIIPWGSVAWRTNFLSAVVAALAIGLIFTVIYQATTSIFASAIAAIALASCPVYWGQAVLGDKYALNGLLTAGLLWGAWHFYVRPGIRSLTALAFLSGLGLAHHRSLLILSLPITAMVSLKGRRLLSRLSSWAAGALALTAPLLLYGYVPWAASRNLPPYHAEIKSWAQFTVFMLDAGYLRLVSFWPQADGAEVFLSTFSANWGLFLPTLAAIGLAARWLYQPSHRGWLAFVLAGFLLESYLTQNYNVPRRFVFFIPAYVCAAVLIGEGIAGWLNLSLMARGCVIAHAPRVVRTLAIVAFLTLVLAPLPGRWQTRWTEQHVAQPMDIWRQHLKAGGQADRLAASLALVHPRALIVGDWEQTTPLWYAQQVEGICPDCLILRGMHRVADYAIRATKESRPLYVARTLNQAANWSKPTAVGPLVHLNSIAETRLPDELIQLNLVFDGRVRLAGYTWPLGKPEPRPGAVLPISLIWQGMDTPPPDYALSLRLFGPGGLIWQADSTAPVLGMNPFGQWEAYQVVADYYEVPIPLEAPLGNYALGIILYQPLPTGGFLNAQVTDASGHVIGEVGPVMEFTLAAHGKR